MRKPKVKKVGAVTGAAVPNASRKAMLKANAGKRKGKKAKI